MANSFRKLPMDLATASGMLEMVSILMSDGRVFWKSERTLPTSRPKSTMLFPFCISRETITHFLPLTRT